MLRCLKVSSYIKESSNIKDIFLNFLSISIPSSSVRYQELTVVFDFCKEQPFQITGFQIN